MKLKYLTITITLFSFALMGFGLWAKANKKNYADRCIGSGTVGLFLVAMPLFLIQESRGKNLKDYMLTKENIEKMQQKEKLNKD